MKHNRPISEEWHDAAGTWAKLDAAALMLEEGKSAFLAQQMARHGDIAVSKAEALVKASDEWSRYVKAMVNARAAATEAKVRCDFLRMRFQEWISADANHRAGSRMT